MYGNRRHIRRAIKRIGAILSKKRAITPGYVFFYILFLPDTWQVLVGVLTAYLLTPVILKPELGLAAKAILYFMVATIGYAAFRGPARGLTGMLKKRILGDRRLQ